MSKTEIHPQAVVSPSARLAAGVKVGAYAIVGEGAELGDGCVIHPHAVVNGPAKYGRNNVFYSFCAIGGDPQDYTYRGEWTELEVGDGNIFREYVTVSRGTTKRRWRHTDRQRKLFFGLLARWPRLTRSGIIRFL